MTSSYQSVAMEQAQTDERPVEWLRRLFPSYVASPFAAYHEEFWDWVWQLHPGERLSPFVAIWPRGAGKSTSAELACAAVAAKKTRRYALYVSETQDQANQHVENVASLFESGAFGDDYAHVSQRLMGKFGNQRGWRVSRLRTASGFTIDAIGLDKSARGIKVDENRPDLIIGDDLDGEEDTIATIEKKLRTLTKRIIPTRGEDCAFLFVQNIVHADGIFARLADGRADFLQDRTVSGPHPAVEGIAYEKRPGGIGHVITAGEATWQSLAFWQAELDEMGLSAFLAECQHDVSAPDGGMFSHLDFRHIKSEAVPALLTGAVWVDPAVTDTDHSDACGISACSVGENGVIYVQQSWEQRSSPLEALKTAIEMAQDLGIDRVGVETDQGGDTWLSVYQQACFALGITLAKAPQFVSDKAGAGYGSKVHRASQMLADYERGRIVHVLGTHHIAEKALRRFPKTKPYDYVDAQFWAWDDCRRMALSGGQRGPRMGEVKW